MDIEDVLKSVPPEVRASVEKNKNFFQRQMFTQLGRTLAGNVEYKKEVFDTIDNLVVFMNAHKHDCIYVSVLPNFQTYSYILVYEQET